MTIIYASCLCTKNKYNELFKDVERKPGQQVQKYHRLMVEGLQKNDGVLVKTVTSLPITRRNNHNLIIKNSKEIDNGIEYNYLPIVNIPIIKNICVVIFSFILTLIYLKKNDDSVVICDILNQSVSIGALLAAKVMGKNSIGIVTDIPMFLCKSHKSLTVDINNHILTKYDSYVFLTKQMNELINKNNRPYVVIEGLVDYKMAEVNNNIENKYQKIVCQYAGAIQKIYGIKYLVEAFIEANIDNSELHLYGDGDFKDELITICKEHNNIKYFGVKLNDYIISEQVKSTLLINPRPTNEEYTQYSFPSKNMEYIVSGTPVLTTRLPGMPTEYYPYVFLIEEETTMGLAETMKFILTKSTEELYLKGIEAKKWVLSQKNNIKQAKLIIELGGKI